MRRVAVTVGALALALVGCGLIPPISVDNPLGLDNQEIEFNLSASPQAVGNFNEEYFFPDQTFNTPILPSSYSVSLGFRRVGFRGQSCAAKNNPPQTIDIEVDKLTAKIADVSNPAGEVTVEIPKFSFQAVKGNDGEYTVNAGGDLPVGIFRDVGKVIEIITKGGQNRTVVSFVVGTTSNPDLAGCGVFFRFNGGKGTVRF